MNLYIWGDQGNIAYGGEAVVVMAPDLKTARKIGQKQANDWSFFRQYKNNTVEHGLKLGKPDKVIRNAAYAAYFMHSE